MRSAPAAAARGAHVEAEPAPRTRPRTWLPLALGLALVALLLAVRALVAEPMRIPSDSMSPTLNPGDQVLVDKLAYRGSATPRRGDLAVFHDPQSSEIMLKRVVAVGGDTVGIEDGELVVNGKRRIEPYADQKAIDSVYFGPVKVPPGTFFALGDNRANSVDSRSFGSVPNRTLIGRVRALVWPPGRWAAAP